MSNAEDLLNSLDESDISVYTVEPDTEPHIVIDEERNITVPNELKRLAVQYDHNAETVTFDCPRYWDGVDMSMMAVYINYLRSDKEIGAYIATNVVVDADDSNIMHFDWTISRNVTEVSGQLVFLVCIKEIDEDYTEKIHWNSELCSVCTISDGLELKENVVNKIYPDIIAAWYREVLGIIDEVNDVKDGLIEMRDAGDLDGATFTPYVSEDCDLSWTNDRGRKNPPTVNIRGISPTIEVTDIQGGHRVTVTDIDGSRYFDVTNLVLDSSESINEALSEFIWISDTAPSTGPVLWFDTSDTT